MEQKEVLLIGFGPLEEKLRQLLEGQNVGVRTIGPSGIQKTVGMLCSEEPPAVQEEAMERGLVLFHNFTREDLDPVLKTLREAGIPRQPLKAMVTPTNWHWKVSDLLEELQQEQEIMGEIIKLKQLRDSLPMPDFRDIPAMKARMMAEVQLSGGEGVTIETIHAAYAELLKFKK